MSSSIQTSYDIVTPNIIQTIKSILSEHGAKGLFRGIEVAIIRAFPANAALFVAYENTRLILNKYI